MLACPRSPHLPGPRRSARAWLTTVAVALSALTGCADTGELGDGATTAHRTVELRVLEEPNQRLAFVPVTIAGQGPYQFILDTGATSTVINTDLAERLDLPVTGREETIAGIVGEDQAHRVRVERWELGGLRLDPTEMYATDLPDPVRGDPVQGLLGSDVLGDFGRIVLDYDNEELRVPSR